MAKITMELIQQLRDRTGVGMMDCKNALTESGGDLDKAVEILRKKGAAIAAKRSGNATVEGLVHSYIHPGSRVGVLLEINCETDFVARTDVLKQFAADICLHIAAMKPLYVSSDEVDSQLLAKERIIFKEQLAASGKPEKIIDQIVEGKIAKFYTEICLLQQPFVKNDKVTVDDVLKDIIAKLGESIKIKRFARFEIGS
jgi:elongation factor Ts